MIVKEYFKIGDMDIVRRYSDANKMIQKVGTEEIYRCADDPIQFEETRLYMETDIDIPVPQEEEEEAASEEAE